MVIDWSGIMGLLFFLLKAIKNMSKFRGYHINQRETKSTDKKLNRCFKNVRQGYKIHRKKKTLVRSDL